MQIKQRKYYLYDSMMIAYDKLKSLLSASACLKTVGFGSWITENSRHKYPGSPTDDGFCCDFVISENGKAHYVEVKATQAEDEAFELGSSEVKLAVDHS